MAWLSKDGISIEYTEAQGSPRESMSNGVFRVSRTFLVNYDDRLEFASLMLGYPKIETATNGLPYVSRVLPSPYMGILDANDKPLVFASQLESIEPVGAIDKADNVAGEQTWDADSKTYWISTYETARVTIVYEAFPYGILSDDELDAEHGDLWEASLARFVTIVPQPHGEYLTLPYGAYKWNDTNKTPVTGSHGIIQSSIEYNIIWHCVPRIPDTFTQLPTAAEDSQGCVNDASFPDALGYNAGTLLLLGVEARPYKLIGGLKVFDITYKVKYFEPEPTKGHNYFLHYTLGGSGNLVARFDRLSSRGDASLSGDKPVYAEKDFTLLFQPS